VLEFLQIPSNIQLQNDGKLSSSDVPLVVNNLLGLSAEKPETWSAKTNLWQRPEAAVMFVISTPHHLKLKLPSVQAYKLQENDLPDFEEVSEAIESTFSDDNPVILNINTAISGQFSDEIRSFRTPTNGETKFALELSSADAVAKWAVTKKAALRNGIPDLFVFEFNGLEDLSRKYTVDSDEMTAAIDELKRMIKQVTNSLVNVYDENVIVCVVSGSGAKVRSPRQARAEPTQTNNNNNKDIKPTTYSFYDQNYPVIFNIILWSMLTLGVALLFIGSSMWFMDPGRDSIIYRMTMTRAKKD
jgi:renin receptor